MVPTVDEKGVALKADETAASHLTPLNAPAYSGSSRLIDVINSPILIMGAAIFVYFLIMGAAILIYQLKKVAHLQKTGFWDF